MWTEDEVARLAAAERVDVLRKNNPTMWKRMEATRIVHEAMRLANERYLVMFAEMQRDLDIGLIGPTGQPHKTNRSAWLAAEVKHRYLRELYLESPIMDEEEHE
jgi:hypothetical protein